jgi:hypothetical protein
MKKFWLLALALVAGAVILSDGCGKNLGPASPLALVPTPPCSSPSNHGFTTVGSSVASFPANVICIASPVTFAADETATSISIYISGTAAGQVRFGIYDTSSANPTYLATQTDPMNLVSNGWTTANLGNVLLPAGVYWLTFQLSDANNIVYQSSTGNIAAYQGPFGWSVFPTSYPSLGSTTGYTNAALSLYISTCP